MQKLQAGRRSFTRVLRYNKAKGAPMPVAWLNDAGAAIAMYVVADDEELQKVMVDTADSQYQRWVWNISESLRVPIFPSKTNFSASPATCTPEPQAVGASAA